MVHFLTDEADVSVPFWVVDLESFRRWADSDDVPEKSRILYLKGEVWVDMGTQQVFTHVEVKTEFTVVLGGLAKSLGLGKFFGDGLLLSNVTADYVGVPDGVFLSTETLQSDRVRWLESERDGGCVEVEGTPDLVLEVVSRSSVHKDTVLLRKAYWEVGIPEYWLVDARQEPLKFDILRHTAKGYTATRKQDGWVKSIVFGKAFRLTQRPGIAGHPEFSLEERCSPCW
ncbi:MAG TPA: Uma2 family endonuclease [Gemmataceae bacterium]|nr:Uma2 family endonuclease [Gemmataceae bacterium]